MVENKEWIQPFMAEIRQAYLSRQTGNEGRARVCARRAAGAAAAEYFRRKSGSRVSGSAFILLQRVAGMEQLPPDVRQRAESFLVRVTPEHNLPTDSDLIAEAKRLAFDLLGERLEHFER
jgi:hypothetical protein